MAQQLLAYDAALAERAAEARPPRVVSLAQIADVAAQIMAAPGALLENQREAFLLLARGEVSICPIQVVLPVQPLSLPSSLPPSVRPSFSRARSLSPSLGMWRVRVCRRSDSRRCTNCRQDQTPRCA